MKFTGDFVMAFIYAVNENISRNIAREVVTRLRQLCYKVIKSTAMTSHALSQIVDKALALTVRGQRGANMLPFPLKTDTVVFVVLSLKKPIT